MSDYEVLVETADPTFFEMGIPGPPGAPGGAVYVHAQAAAAVEWIINHNLGYYPAITLSDTAGNVVAAQLLNVSVNQARAYFNQPAAGTARCL